MSEPWAALKVQAYQLVDKPNVDSSYQNFVRILLKDRFSFSVKQCMWAQKVL